MMKDMSGQEDQVLFGGIRIRSSSWLSEGVYQSPDSQGFYELEASHTKVPHA
jgi:hypothetical protein